VSTSLAAMTTLIQTADIVRFAGRPAPRVGGRDHAGPSASQRLHATADGWVCVDTDAAIDAIVAALRGEAEVGPEELDEVLAGMSRATTLQRLRSAGIPAVPARWLHEVAADAGLRDAGLIRPYPAHGFESMVTTGEHAHFARTPPPPTSAAPRLGEHSVAVLTEVGLTTDEITALLDAGVITQAPTLPAGTTTLW
jgi:crotonobetainyl-CoA:carnitine CoA-transferase CaiB-like acyl-CoA transferase